MSAIRDESALRDVIGVPTPLVSGKIANQLNDLTRHRHGRGGIHAVLEGVGPVRPLESGAVRRPIRAAKLGGDPQGPQLDVDEYERARAERYARGDGLY